MLYKDGQCLTYLVSLKQLKQKLHIEKKKRTMIPFPAVFILQPQ